MFAAMLIMAANFSMKAQSIKDTFDSNMLEWTECPYESIFDSFGGTAVIDKGVMTLKSRGPNDKSFIVASKNTFFETHCYAPLEVNKPFKVTTRVKIARLRGDMIAGFVFNYRDGGNYYCFSIDDKIVKFSRYVDGVVVGSISQGVKWTDKKDVNQEWELTSVNDILTFVVDGVPILKVRYMPIEYSGMGFYTFGSQTLVVDDIEFTQL